MPANYRPCGGGPGGRYYNNGGHNGPRPSYHPPPHRPSLSNRPMPKPMSHSPQKVNKPAPRNESAEVPKPTPIKQETKVQKVEPIIDTSADANDSGSKIKKFTQRSRLFVGNMPSDVTDEEFKELFKKYGEISETFVHASKGFGFVRLDTRANAERAKLELNGHTIKGRDLKIRFASHGAALSLKHLSPYVSNELLESAFARFGPVERAVVIADDRGRSTGRGIVEFARKSSATKALSQISEGCFLLTSSPQAIVAKPLDQEDTEDGLPEKNIHKTQQYTQEREAPPRFSLPGTFEHEFALRWKALDEMERQQQEQLNKNISAARAKLEIEMENAIHEHKTMLMKQELIRRQEELSRIEEQRQRDLERRKQLEYEREDQHKKELEALAKRQEILRAQIEGTYPGSGDAPPRGPRSIPAGFGGPPPMARDGPMDYMGGGKGSLGPAPSRQARFEPGPGGRSFPPPPFPSGPPSGQGFGPGQRRGYPGGPMDFDNVPKRRRY